MLLKPVLRPVHTFPPLSTQSADALSGSASLQETSRGSLVLATKTAPSRNSFLCRSTRIELPSGSVGSVDAATARATRQCRGSSAGFLSPPRSHLNWVRRPNNQDLTVIHLVLTAILDHLEVRHI